MSAPIPFGNSPPEPASKHFTKLVKSSRPDERPPSALRRLFEIFCPAGLRAVFVVCMTLRLLAAMIIGS
jgi:hypothetical protein